MIPDPATGDAPGDPGAEQRGENSDAIAIGLVGDEWNLAILQLALRGVRRYGEFYDRLGIANSVLTGRLRRLTEAGVFTRLRYLESPPRFEYRLTECGLDLWQILLTIWSWEAIWVTDHPEPLPEMYHLRCGRAFTPHLHCRTCGDPADLHTVRGEFGPSGGFARFGPRATTRRRSAGAEPGGTPGRTLVAQTIALIGNRWSAAALAAALLGARRFTDFLQMTGAPPTVVSDRLRTFCAMGVLHTVSSPTGSGRVEYRLTDKGRAFFPHIAVLLSWGDRWFRAPEGPAWVFTHTPCGGSFVPVLFCSACGSELHRSEIQVGGDAPHAG